MTMDGGYAEYVVVDAHALAAIPDDLDSTDAAPLLCAGITTYNALRQSGAVAGDLVAILGVGGLGHLGVQFAAKLGFDTVAIARGTEKEELARELGARHYIDSTGVRPGGGAAGARRRQGHPRDGDQPGRDERGHRRPRKPRASSSSSVRRWTRSRSLRPC